MKDKTKKRVSELWKDVIREMKEKNARPSLFPKDGQLVKLYNGKTGKAYKDENGYKIYFPPFGSYNFGFYNPNDIEEICEINDVGVNPSLPFKE